MGDKALKISMSMVQTLGPKGPLPTSLPLTPSTTGSIVSCAYFIIVKARLEGFSISSTGPAVRHSFVIVAPPPADFGL